MNINVRTFFCAVTIVTGSRGREYPYITLCVGNAATPVDALISDGNAKSLKNEKNVSGVLTIRAKSASAAVSSMRKK